MPAREGEGTHGLKFWKNPQASAFAARIWTTGWTELRDRETMRLMTSLGRGNRRWRLTPGPALRESQRGHDRLRDFQYALPPRPDHLGRDVDHHPAPRRGVTGDWQHLDQHIVLEGFREKEGDQHTVGEGGIGRKPLEGERLKAEIFQPTMRQFVRAPSMVAGNKRLGLGPVGSFVDRCEDKHRRVDAQVRQDDIVGTRKVQQALPIGIRHGPGVQRPVVPRPARTPPPEFQILPFLVPIVIDRPLRRVLGSDIRFDSRIHLPGHDETDLQLVTRLQDGLIEQATVEADDNHHLGPTGLAHEGNHPAQHIDDGVARVPVLAPPAKDSVHNLARPDHLQGRKAFDLFVGRLDTMSLRGLVVIQHPGIDAGRNHPGTRQLEPPGTQLIENRAEASTGNPGKGFEEPFHRMRRGHLGTGHLDRGRIPRIRLEMIEIPQVPTRPSEQETEQLLKEGPEGQALATFAE